MSIIKSKSEDLSKNELNEDKINISKNKSIIEAKEIIKKLLQSTLNISLLKLESNSANQIASLKISSKSFNDFSKLINNLSLNVEEFKKKKFKEKERKAQAFKKGKKMVTEYNLNNRSKTIESNLMKFKNKVINIDGKKIISKISKRANIIGHKSGNKTMSSFRNINEIEQEQENNNQRFHRFKNISFQNASQNFRRVNHKIIPTTPVAKLREQEKNQIIAKATKTKNIGYRNIKNNHSRTVILSHLTDIDEKNENIEKNKNNYSQSGKVNNKNVKRIIYKNENKNKVIRINYKTEKDNNEIKNNLNNRNIHENLNKSSLIKTADDINKDINNNNTIINSTKSSNKDIIRETNELKSIVKLVDDVNENLNKLLKVNPNQSKRRTSFKEAKFQNQSTNALINSLEISEHKLNNEKNMNKENNGKGKTNIPKSYSLNYSQMRENIIYLKKKEDNIIELFKNRYKKNNKINPEEKEQNGFKSYKSCIEIGYNLRLFAFNINKIYSKSSGNIITKQKKNKKKEIGNKAKKFSLIKKMKILPKDNYLNNNNDNEKIKIINSIIEIILDKTKNKIEAIKKDKENQNKNILINKDENKNNNMKKIKENNMIKDENQLNLNYDLKNSEIIKLKKFLISKSEKGKLKYNCIFPLNVKYKERKAKSFDKINNPIRV